MQEIRTLRKELGLSQRQLAERLGVKRLTIARWESGIMKPNPERLVMLEKLAHDTKNVSSGENVSCNDTNDTTQNDTNDTNDTKHDTNVSSESVSSDQNVSSHDTKNENVSKKQDTKLTGIGGMRSSFAQHVLDEIDIVQLVSEDTTIEGDKAQCPFPDHDDTDPSFRVYPDTQSFNCFGCKKGGSAIDYIMHRDSVDPAEAIRILCEWANIPLPEWTPEQKAEWEQKKQEKDVIANILGDAFQIYHDEMDETRWNDLRGRGFTNETIKKELLCYAPDDDTFLFSRLKEKYDAKELLLSGLFVKMGAEGVPTQSVGIAPRSDGIKDAYQRRYLFPYWHQRKISYSIGRLDTNDPKEIKQLPKWNRGKYKKHLTHTKKHPYVSKTIENIIYNADSVRAFNDGIITEGIVDALLAKQAGFGVISPVTTKFAKRDIEELRKLSKHWNTVYIINDNEVSGEGEKGAIQTAERLFGDGQDVRLVTLPRPEGVEKIDLADFLNVPKDQQETRIDELKQLMSDAPDYIEWKISEVADLPERDRPKPTRGIFALLANVDDKLALERYSDAMQRAELVSKQSFKDTLKDARIKRAKQRKQEQMEFLESESPELFLKAQIQEVRKDKYGKAFEVKQNVSKIILDDMLGCGRFYQTVSQEYFWFEDKANVLYPIGNEALGVQINNKYGINQSETEYEFLMQDLLTEASVNGNVTNVYNFAFYDNDNHILYVFNNADQIYRLDGKEIKLVANGADGVLFLKDSDWESFEYRNVGDTDCLAKLIINPINFVDGDHVNLSKDEQRFMFMLWIYSLFFESIQPTKPILTIIGEKGSGKTTVQRVVGKMLLGSRFDVTPIAKEDDFDATISNNYIVCFDNVDGKIDWLNDRLAHTATGKMIQKRKLYTTNENIRFFPKCFLGLNAREPKFKRDDVVDRLLLFRVKRLPSIRSEHIIIDNMLTHRNELWSELLNELNEIVAALAQDDEPFASQHRMADWADLGWRIAKTQGLGDSFVKLLEKMDKEQSIFLLEDNIVFLCLDAWLAEPSNQGREVTSSTLYNEFQIIAEREKMSFTFKSTRSFGMHLRNILSNLGEFFDVLAEKKRNKWIYTFNLKT